MSRMDELLIRGVDVLQCASEECRVLRDQDILVRGHRIEAVEPAGGAGVGENIEVIPGAGMLAMPGLINTHAHVPMSLFRGLAEDVDIATWFNEYIWPLESNLRAEDVYWGMQLGLAEMIEAGVTSVADHYFHMDRAADAVERPVPGRRWGGRSLATRARPGWSARPRSPRSKTARPAPGFRPGWHRTLPTPAMMSS